MNNLCNNWFNVINIFEPHSLQYKPGAVLWCNVLVQWWCSLVKSLSPKSIEFACCTFACAPASSQWPKTCMLVLLATINSTIKKKTLNNQYVWMWDKCMINCLCMSDYIHTSTFSISNTKQSPYRRVFQNCFLSPSIHTSRFQSPSSSR